MTSVHCHYAYHLHLEVGHRCQVHAHQHTEVVYSWDCAGILHQREQRLPWRGGECFVYQPPGEHWIACERPGTQVCVCVRGCDAERLPPGVHAVGAGVAETAALIRDILEQGGQRQAARLDLAAGLLVLSLHECLATEPAAPPPPAEAARALIDDHFDRELDVNELAAAVYVSPAYLRQLFRGEFGMSPTSYLIQRRIQHACDLLEHGDLPVKEVAAASGIANPYYFARLFRKVQGCTPSAYRRRFRG